MIRVKEQYAAGEYPWTEAEVVQVRTATALALGLAVSHACLGAWCGIKGEAVGYWLSVGVIPAKHVPAVAAATGVNRAELRPDVYRVPETHVAEYKQFCEDRPGRGRK